jgi:glycosyltransferase involved in cell wall biosynthesis
MPGIDSSQKIYDVCLISSSELKTDARTLNLARTLAKHQKTVCVIAPCKPEDKPDIESKWITIIPIKASGASRAFIRILSFSKKVLKYKKLIKSKIYWAEDLFALYATRKFSDFHNGKLFYDSREIYSAPGPLAKRQLSKKIQSWLELMLIKSVDRFIVTGKLDAEYLSKYFKASKPFDVIMNLPPYKDKIKSNLIREKFSIDEDTAIIIYQGMLLPGRGIIPLIEAMLFVKDAVFCIAGEGRFKETITEKIDSLNLTNKVILCGKTDYSHLHELTCSACVGVAFIEPISLSYQYALPNKMFEYCMARIPTLASDLPAMADIIGQYKIGELISPDSTPKEIASAINELIANKHRYIQECDKAARVFCYESLEKLIIPMVEG